MSEPTNSQKTKVLDTNALYHGLVTEKLMEKAGYGVARFVVKKFGANKDIGIFCGLGNNGGDGLVAARYLSAKNKVTVYLFGNPKQIKTKESQLNWQRLKKCKCSLVINPSLKKIQDNHQIIIEALFGVGVKGKLKAPSNFLIKKLNRFRAKKVAVDVPAPGFKAHHTVSMHFAKVPGATVVDIGIPRKIEELIGPGEVKLLTQPKPNSHKGDNGKLLIIGGSKKYHGAPLLAAKIAAKFVDLVYFSSVTENNELIKKMKEKLCEFIAVPNNKVLHFVSKVDTVLFGPGLEVNESNKELINILLAKYTKKKFVLDAAAFHLVDKKLFNTNHILTPHAKEFKKCFGLTGNLSNVKRMSKKHGCIIVLKGAKDIICSSELCKFNTAGNQGMTKGGTGDVLAGLIAALACTNDNWLAAAAGTFLNGLAADQLKKRISYYYSASDLVKQVPVVARYLSE